ncbi:UV-stimulated scaffold protein A isoform X2 [Poecile atricapillus]|uniref:UV-stimulated scaffold protein A isoform X2 n=1 Tax=Poecile atricapillus TaxID=48891 RepID=UPI0027397811|nr:UV-stimulated scaffold protein A isoform X2 [Poecile atricapillus]
MDQRLAELVEELTTSGEPRLEPGRMKELKKICKSSEEHISHAYHLLVTRLQEEHAEMRFSAFQVVQELFARSHQFRTLLISNFQEFLELTVGIDHEQPLPPPKEVAQKLRKAAIKAVQDWHEKYGEAYKQLSLGYHFLKQNKKVDFQDVHARTVAERRREEEKQKRLENIYKEKVKRTEKEMEDIKVQENEDNTAIINSVMDAHKLLRNKFWPSVQSWIQLLTRAGINDDRLRCAIELKNKLETAMKKYKEMNISFKARKRKVIKASDDDDEDEDEDEFVEVPEKEGYEPHIPDHLRKEYGLEPRSPPKAPVMKASTGAAPLSSHTQPKGNEDELDPTCAAATLKLIRDKLPKLPSPQDSESATSETANLEDPDSKRRKLEERAKAPLMPFGLDLHYWGEDQPSAGKIIKFTSEHRFWAPSEVEEEVENKEITEMLKTRYITFAGKFEPVKHKCRAPMPGGTLCERQDRIKCPFHGKIIPRDDSGIPVNAEDRAREEKMKFEKQAAQPEWRDPEFMREVEAATGLDLGSSKSNGKGQKKKGKKQKYPNLTDVKQQANTSRSRLEKKVFNKGAMKRVVKAMNRVDQRKHEKFANQFNYALN